MSAGDRVFSTPNRSWPLQASEDDHGVVTFPNTPPRANTMTERDLDGLMAAAQRGNGGAYRRLLDEARVWLKQYYARRLPPSVVDDAVQETLLAVHEKRHTYDPSRPFGPWLVAIARYKWIDRLRALKAAPTEALGDDLTTEDHAGAVMS